MMIYLVSGGEYEERYICAAFTSLQDAEKFINEKNAECMAKSKYADPHFYRFAEEVELDSEVPSITS